MYDRCSLKQNYQRDLNEGIDFDYDTMTVSYNPSHEENVDTSLKNNPTKDDSIIQGIPVEKKEEKLILWKNYCLIKFQAVKNQLKIY